MNHIEEIKNKEFELIWLTNYLIPFIVSATAGFMADREVQKKIRFFLDDCKKLMKDKEDLLKVIDKKENEFEAQKTKNESFSFLSDLESKFNDLVWKHKSDENLKEKLIQFICHKFKVEKAVLFITEISDNIVQLIPVAHRGLSDKVEIEIVKPGVSVIGQCYIEMEPFHLDDVPEEFFNIASGLGKSVPKCLNIYPLIYNEKVLGVLELASFNSKQSLRDPMMRVCELLAIVLHSLNEESKIVELLKDSEKKSNLLLQKENQLKDKLQDITSMHSSLLENETLLKEQIDKNE